MSTQTERHWISRWPATLAIVIVALAISTAVVLSQHHRSAPARTTTPARLPSAGHNTIILPPRDVSGV